MSVHRIILVIIAIALISSTTGCGTKAVNPATTPASTGDFPIGTFTNSDQSWTWEFKTDGSYLAQGLQSRENGNFTVDGNQISISGDYCGEITGNYTWTYDGTALTFEMIDDKCTDRLGVVVTGNWVKKPKMAIIKGRYLAYLLRLWHVKNAGRWIWRASLEDAHTGERQGFVSLEALIAFLWEKMRNGNHKNRINRKDEDG